MAARNPRGAFAVLGVTCAVLAMVAAGGYVFWGWVAMVSHPVGLIPSMVVTPWDPNERAEALAAYRRASFFARACMVSGMLFGGVALGCALFAGWRDRHDWRSWPWLSLVFFVPAFFALAIALIGRTGPAVQELALAVQIVALLAGLFELWRAEPSSASRLLSWTVLVVSLLAIVIRPLLWR